MRITKPAAILTAGSLALVLSGCFANPLEQLVQGGAEGIVEQVTGGNVDVGLGGSASVPDDFPAEVPLPPGSPTTTFSIEGAFQLTYVDADDSAAEALLSAFDAAGFTQVASSDMGEFKTWIYENERYTVTLGVLSDDETTQLILGVSPKR